VSRKYTEILEIFGGRLFDCGGHGGCRGFKPDPQQHHLPLGMVAGDLQRLEAPVNDPDVGASAAFGIERRGGTRDAHQIAKGGDGDVWLLRQPDGPVNVFIGSDAHRTTRPTDESDRGWQELPQAEAKDGDGMGAADFHQVAGAKPGTAPLKGFEQAFGELGIAVFVEIFQVACSLKSLGSDSAP